jgi:hypothetical protein
MRQISISLVIFLFSLLITTQAHASTAGAATGTAVGSGITYWGIAFLGGGTSASAISVALATAGSVVGGGMMAGVLVVSAPVALGALIGYSLF